MVFGVCWLIGGDCLWSEGGYLLILLYKFALNYIAEKQHCSCLQSVRNKQLTLSRVTARLIRSDSSCG